MDITGARWGLDGGEAILKLRSIVKSEDFEKYWEFHLQEELSGIMNRSMLNQRG